MVQVRLVRVGDGVRNGSEGAERAGSDQTWSLADPDQRDEFHDAAGGSGGADCCAAGGAAGPDPLEEARIAALPAAQQAMIRSRMGGGTPTTVTTRSCAAEQTSLNALMSEAQQKNTKCTFTNQVQIGR